MQITELQHWKANIQRKIRDVNDRGKACTRTCRMLKQATVSALAECGHGLESFSRDIAVVWASMCM